jgi:pimeloyl-ACP methyl ester carboxylesterase
VFSYPSIHWSLSEIAARLAQGIVALRVDPVHVVAHSLGGLATLEMLTRYPDVPVRRVVLLGTSCAGSRAAQGLARSKIGRALVGKAINQWEPEHGRVAAGRFEVGMIAGTLPLGLGQWVASLSKPHDGAVCVAETRMPGLRDHLTLRVSHSGLIVSARVMQQVVGFLEHGHFTRA